MFDSSRFYTSTRRTPNGQPADGSAETVQDVIAFFYDMLRDYPELVARINQALEERYAAASARQDD